jgi:photosystem II stability/assembly factor-like uncharacterized protein
MLWLVSLWLVIGCAAWWGTQEAQAQRGQRQRTEARKDETKEKPDAEKKKEEEPKGPFVAETFSGLKLRSLGPAVTAGRVSDLAVHPKNKAVFYVAVASGGVWKTENAGGTWTPLFDSQGSYSIGVVRLDPNHPEVVWVGTGENNAQRSVSYGDGVYKSEDGGRSWKNMGLKESRHIGSIVIDPRDSNVVYVAAHGPLWGPGGDRGLYKTTDGGKTWSKVLEISENTGVNEVVMDPRNPDVLYAAAWQRRRHVWTLITGGPESGIHKTTDGGKTWTKLASGLPSGHVGRIGLAISPANPDVVYAIVPAADREKQGIYRTTNRGVTWERRGGTITSGNYYQEIVADPKDVDRVYIMDTFLQVTDDGGRTARRAGERLKHVDNHALWIDPDNTDYLLNGNDGGVYESFDRGRTWIFKANLPVTQFYDVAVDNSEPFYYVYGGTQDNYTLGGPSRTITQHGIANSDWFVVVGGDGFKIQIDPTDPNIVYAESQYGGLVRHDRRTGEILFIQPQEGKDDPPNRWNWDSPLLISPHAHTRLYFASQRVYRSDDRGGSWRAISGDLTRQMDRNQLKVMGRIWGPDAVERGVSTSPYGNLTALVESPKMEGLLYAGSDDGLVHVTEDGGGNWRKIETFPGVPERTYVQRLLASQHDANTVYAVMENHKNNDFKPYVLKSSDRGKTWTSIAGNLPEHHPALAIAEDHVNPNLLFVGTEFGLFFTVDGGQKWVQLKGGLPTIAVRDLAVQKRENDLVLATFGRGFYILDDYTPLRAVTPETLEKEAHLFTVKDAPTYVESLPLGLRGAAFQGASYYLAPNPPFGATATYYLKEAIKTRKEVRQEKEKEAEKKKEDLPFPSFESLRAEEQEEKPSIVVTVSDAAGNVVRRISGPVGKGMHRVTWDLRYAPSRVPTERDTDPDNPFVEGPQGPLAAPGEYTVSIAKRVDGAETPLGEPQKFQVYVLGSSPLQAKDRPALAAFQRQVAELQRAAVGTQRFAGGIEERLTAIHRALDHTPAAPPALRQETRRLQLELEKIQIALRGDRFLAQKQEPTVPGVLQRIQFAVFDATSEPTGAQREQYRIAAELFQQTHARLKSLVETDLKQLEDALEKAGAPWTPGRLPEWKGPAN